MDWADLLFAEELTRKPYVPADGIQRVLRHHPNVDKPKQLADPSEEVDENGVPAGGWPVKVETLEEANLITSEVEGLPGYAAPCIDIDVPVRLVPSTTEGHGHLFFDMLIPEDKYIALLEAMADAGIVERGYLAASMFRGYTAVRPAHVKKRFVEDES